MIFFDKAYIFTGCPVVYNMALKSTEIKQIKSNVGFWGDRGENWSNCGGKPLKAMRREPTNSTRIWRRIRESILGHIGGWPVVLPVTAPELLPLIVL